MERKTLRELAKIQGDHSLENGLKGWKITAERKRIVPARLRIQEEMKRQEEARLRGETVIGAKEEASMMMV